MINFLNFLFIFENKRHNVFSHHHKASKFNIFVAYYMEDIRLNTAVPIFVNWKLHAFKNDEIIEWYKRIKIVNNCYESKNAQYQLSFSFVLKNKNYVDWDGICAFQNYNENPMNI